MATFFSTLDYFFSCVVRKELNYSLSRDVNPSGEVISSRVSKVMGSNYCGASSLKDCNKIIYVENWWGRNRIFLCTPIL